MDAKGRVTSVTTVNISGVPPGGTAGGDLGGTYPNPTVTRLQGRGVAAAIPLNGYVLVWNNANSLWEPTLGATPTGSAGGDLTGTYPNPALMTQGLVTPGTYGTSTAVAQLTVDEKGRVTSVRNVTITGAPATGPAGGDLAGNYPDPSLVTLIELTPGRMVPRPLLERSLWIRKDGLYP